MSFDTPAQVPELAAVCTRECFTGGIISYTVV